MASLYYVQLGLSISINILTNSIFKLNNLISNIHEIVASGSIELSENDKQFIQRIYSDGLDKYEQRIKALGFSGVQKVLDAGCGYGQWTLALAALNAEVYACDISETRTSVLASLADAIGTPNLIVDKCPLTALVYDDNSFDIIFCYGVIYVTPWRAALRELYRVLKPGGRIYLNANGLGWFIYLWKEEHNKAADYDPRQVVADSLRNTIHYERDGVFDDQGQILIEPTQLKKEMEDLGFDSVQISAEGCLHLNHAAASPKPFFREEYYGQLGVYEAVCTKAVV